MFCKIAFFALVGCALVMSQPLAEQRQEEETFFEKFGDRIGELYSEGKKKFEIFKTIVDEEEKKVGAELEVLDKKLEENLRELEREGEEKYEEYAKVLSEEYNVKKAQLKTYLNKLGVKVQKTVDVWTD